MLYVGLLVASAAMLVMPTAHRGSQVISMRGGWLLLSMLCNSQQHANSNLYLIGCLASQLIWKMMQKVLYGNRLDSCATAQIKEYRMTRFSVFTVLMLTNWRLIKKLFLLPTLLNIFVKHMVSFYWHNASHWLCHGNIVIVYLLACHDHCYVQMNALLFFV